MSIEGPPRLWRSGPFVRLWVGESISAAGTQLAGLAIPTLAVTVLAATTFEMGVLNAVETSAFLLIGLPAGAWIDRMRKRRVMIVADLARFVLLASIPAAWALGVLTLAQLFVVAALVGAAAVFFDVAYQSYPPLILPGELIAPANSALETSQQVARVGGPALSGILLAVLRPALVVGIDALSFLGSFLALVTIRDDETPPDRSTRRPLVVEIREGAAFVLGQPLLRRIVATTALNNLATSLVFTLLPLLVLRELRLGTEVWGLTVSVGAVGGLVGAASASRVARALGEGRVIPIASVISALGALAFATPALWPVAAIPLLVVAELLLSWGVLVYNIAQVSFRQRICPPALLGRMNASIRFVVWGVMPIGGLLAGVLGTALGVPWSMAIGGAGALLATAPVLFSPLRRLRTLPAEAGLVE